MSDVVWAGRGRLAGLLQCVLACALLGAAGAPTEAQVREQRIGDWTVRVYLDAGTYVASVPGDVSRDSSLLAVACYRGWLATGERGRELFVTVTVPNFVWYGEVELRYQVDQDSIQATSGLWDAEINWIKIEDAKLAHSLNEGTRQVRVGVDDRWIRFSLNGASRALAPVLAACGTGGL